MKSKHLLLLSLAVIAVMAKAEAQSFTLTDLPAALLADGYTRLNAAPASLTYNASGTTVTCSYASYTLPGGTQPTTTNFKLVVTPAAASDFSGASFVQADTVNTIAQTVQFTVRSGLTAGTQYSYAMSAAADLSVVTVGPASVAPGAALTYTLRISNAGPCDVQNAIVTMPSLGNFTVTSITATGTWYSSTGTPTSVPATYAATDLTTGLTIPAIAAYGGITIVVNGTAATTGAIDATTQLSLPAGITDLNTANNTSAFTTQIFTPGVLTRYDLNLPATGVSAGVGADPSPAIDANGNYSFNLVYTLRAGDAAIPSLGDTITVPVSYTALENKANGALNKWRRYTVGMAGGLYDVISPVFVPTVSTVGNLVNFSELPKNNQRSVTDTVSSAVEDMFYRTKTQAGYVMPLGVFNMTLGALPVPTDTAVSLVDATYIHGGGGYSAYLTNPNNTVTTEAAFLLRPLYLTAQAPNTVFTVSDRVRPNATYPFMYIAHNDNNPVNGLMNNNQAGPVIAAGTITFSSPAVPLPLHLLSFVALKQHSEVQLEWNTAAETGTRSYGIERSADGKNFKSIGSVAAVSSDGDHSYAFTDEAPLQGMNIYRLKMAGDGDAVSYSPQRSVVFTSAAGISVSPNPASDVFYVNNAPVGASIRVADMGGHVIKEQVVTFTSQPVDIGQCAGGTYVVQVILDGKILEVLKIVKQ